MGCYCSRDIFDDYPYRHEHGQVNRSSGPTEAAPRIGTVDPEKTSPPEKILIENVQVQRPPPSVEILPKTFDETYEIGDALGSGGFAVVFVGTHIKSGKKYAVKKVDRSKTVWSQRDTLDDEINNLERLRSGPHIVKLFDTYKEDSFCYLVLEWMKGGHLFNRLVQKQFYTEKEARDACQCLLKGVEHMHKHSIVHRDLKPENLLLVDNSSDTNLKLSDFGFSRKVHYENQLRTLCGTAGYIAPEILERWPAYHLECDLWSVGVILYELLGGCSPFGTEDTEQIYARTRIAAYEFHPANFDQVSTAAKILVTKLLTVNPQKRISATDALKNEWMLLDDDVLSQYSIDSEGLRSINSATQKLRGAVTAITAANRLEDLKKSFNKFMDSERQKQEERAAQKAPPSMSLSKTGRPFADFFNVGDVLGTGGFAIVYRTTLKTTGEISATKIVNIAEMRQTTGRDLEATMKTLRDEITALKILRGGPNIIRLFEVFEEPDQVYMVMEEMKGGSLLERIAQKAVYTEREARKVSRLIFEAVDYCHKKKIAHRDLKPENILMLDNESDIMIKIADFGFAKRVKGPNSLTTFCGTPNYVAPEIVLLQSYDQRVDNWSVGVIVYVLLGGYTPFEGSTSQLLDIIPTGSYQFHEEHWSHISQSAQDLVASLLNVNPEYRITAGEALECDWMQAEEETLSATDLSSAQQRITQRMPVEKVRGAVQAVIATNKLTSLGSTRGSRSRVVKASSVKTIESIREDSFEDVYDLGDKMGSASYSTVFEVIHKETKETYTLKRIDRKYLSPANAVAVQDEISTLQQLRGCPNIVTIREVFDEVDYGYVIMETMTGGDLLNRISEKESYTEADAKKIFANLLSGVRHCHDHRIANRGLQADNLFLVSPESDTDIKITDFGFAKKVFYPNSLRTQCGTIGYVAPEILSHSPAYDVSCDMWSAGVILFLLLGGYRPFRGSDDDEIMELTRYGKYNFDNIFWVDISEEAKDLIGRMLTVDPKKRITAEEALQTRWIRAADDELEKQDLAKTQRELQSIVGRRKLRISVMTIMAANKLMSLGKRHRAFMDF